MRIKTFEISAIDARRYTKLGEKLQNLRIDNNSTITQIIQISENEASLEYRYTANYVGVGVIKLEGKLHLEGSSADLADTWSKTNNMPPEVANIVHGSVITHCMPVAVVLARDIGLPPPLPPFPGMQAAKKPGKVTDSRRHSPEIT